jgi:hypothetical protein
VNLAPMKLNDNADHMADNPTIDTQSSEFKQLIQRRKLQAIVALGAVVMIVMLLYMAQITTIPKCTPESCSADYQNNYESSDYLAQWDLLNGMVQALQLGSLAIGGAIWGCLAVLLYRDVQRWLINVDQQRQIEARTVLHLSESNLSITLYLETDGEIGVEDPLLSSPAASLYQPMTNRPAARALVSIALRWFFRDVLYLLHAGMLVVPMLVIVGLVFQFVIHSGLNEIALEFLIVSPLLLMLGASVIVHWDKMTQHWAKRDAALAIAMQNLDLTVQERLNQAGLSMDEIDMDTLVGTDDITGEDTAKPKHDWNSPPVASYLLPEIETRGLRLR